MKHFVKSLPVLSILLALACDILLPDSAQHPAAEHPYFTWALLIGLAVYVIALQISLGNTKVRDKLSYSALFYAGAVLVLNILNLLTAKFAILPVLYFPSLDRVFGVLVEDSAFLATCLAYSARLLFFGWLGGAVVGVLTLGIPWQEYWKYTYNALTLNNFWLGIFHGFVYGWIISLCGCYYGIYSGRNADSVGVATTNAVVSSIVWMIVVTGFLTVFFQEVNI